MTGRSSRERGEDPEERPDPEVPPPGSWVEQEAAVALEDVGAERVLDRLREQRDEWVRFVTELAQAESPSTVPESQVPVLDLLGWALEELGFQIRVVPGRETGGQLLARPPAPWARGPAQLILGHSDTVWPEGTLSKMPVEGDGTVLRGPGVFDMKAGLAQAVFALRTLRDLGLEPSMAPVVFINSDEEIGSPESTGFIRMLARRSRRAFILEPALDPEGLIKTARKGTGRFRIRVVGRSSHAGLAPREGASAIQELALVVQTLHGLADYDRGILVNVGEIRGGVRPNVVAAEAEAEVDVRVNTMAEARELEDAIRTLEPRTPGCRLEIQGAVDRPPLERTPRNRVLWHGARAVGRSIGLELNEGRAGGASDGNTTSLLTATLDGLGAVGDGAHAAHEYVDVDRCLERAALLAGLLLLPDLSGDGARSGGRRRSAPGAGPFREGRRPGGSASAPPSASRPDPGAG